MEIEKMSDGVFYLLKGQTYTRSEFGAHDNLGYVLPAFARFKKEHPELRIMSVTPLLETVGSLGEDKVRLANMGYMIITEPALPQNMPCGCRCLIHGKVE